MKPFIKKFLCVMMSILLLSSNVQIFAQELPGEVLTEVDKISADIKKLKDIYECMYQETAALYYGTGGVMKEGLGEMPSLSVNYQELKPVVKEYIEVSGEYLKEMKYYVDNLEIIYSQFSDEVFDTSVPELIKEYRTFMAEFSDKAKHLSEIKHFEEGLTNFKALHNFSVKYGKQFLEREEACEYIIDALRQVYSDGQALAIFKGNTLISKDIKISKLLEEFSSQLPEERAKIILSLIASDENVTTTNLINYLSKFLNKFNNKMTRIKQLSPANLEKMLLKMTTHERAEYINNILDVSQENRILAKQIKNAEKAGGKKIISKKNFLKGGSATGPLIVFAAIFVALSITDLYAVNSFAPNNNINLPQLEEEGEMSSVDMFRYLEPQNRHLLANKPAALMMMLKDMILLDENLDSITAVLEEEQKETEKSESENVINKSLNPENFSRVQDNLMEKYSPSN